MIIIRNLFISRWVVYIKYGDFEVFSGDNYEVFLLELKLEGFDFDFDNFLFEMVVLDFDIILI